MIFPLLVDHFLDDCAIQSRTRRKRIDLEALAILSAYAWPGNVRELKNLIERLVILVPGERITADDIPLSYKTRRICRHAPSKTTIFPLTISRNAKKSFRRSLYSYESCRSMMAMSPKRPDALVLAGVISIKNSNS
jgi:DNA-binding NtrC family response regulator